MEGGDLWKNFKSANRYMLTKVAPKVLTAVGATMPLLVGQPELVPAGIAIAHLLNTAGQKVIAPAFAEDEEDKPPPPKLSKVSPKVEPQVLPKTERYSRYSQNNISPDSKMPYRRSYGSGLHAPRSRGCGFDSISPLAKASLGHAQANSMLGKLETHLAEARQHNKGLIGVSGNLINQSPPLQSQPQQNFQFRHTLFTPAYHPTVFGNYDR